MLVIDTEIMGTTKGWVAGRAVEFQRSKHSRRKKAHVHAVKPSSTDYNKLQMMIVPIWIDSLTTYEVTITWWFA